MTRYSWYYCTNLNFSEELVLRKRNPGEKTTFWLIYRRARPRPRSNVAGGAQGQGRVTVESVDIPKLFTDSTDSMFNLSLNLSIGWPTTWIAQRLGVIMPVNDANGRCRESNGWKIITTTPCDSPRRVLKWPFSMSITERLKFPSFTFFFQEHHFFVVKLKNQNKPTINLKAIYE